MNTTTTMTTATASAPAFLSFTACERRRLAVARDVLARRLGREVELETCADDGHEWALFALADESPEGFAALVSVQLVPNCGRSFVPVSPAAPRAPRRRSETDLEALLPELCEEAATAFRALMPALGRRHSPSAAEALRH